jgi:hypothetical protein
MPQREPMVELNAGYSEPDAKAPTWAQVQDLLSDAKMFWLSTVRNDGRPHVTPLPAVWVDGRIHFCVGSLEQKARNLVANPRCVLATGPNHFGSGLDVSTSSSKGPLRACTIKPSLSDWRRSGSRSSTGPSNSPRTGSSTPPGVSASFTVSSRRKFCRSASHRSPRLGTSSAADTERRRVTGATQLADRRSLCDRERRSGRHR